MSPLKQPVRTSVLAGFIFCLIALLGCTDPAPSVFHANGSTMGTTYSVKIAAPVSASEGEKLQQAFDQLLLDVNRVLSTYQTDSELSRFNQERSTQWQPVSGDLLTVLSAAQEISLKSDGAFDVTVGPLVNLWGFGPEFKVDQRPTPGDISAALSRTGYQLLLVDKLDQSIKKTRPDLYVDLSSIAKGFGVDRLAAYIESQGYLDYMVEVGGEVFCKGRNGQAEAWQIAIEKPLVGERSILRVVPLTDQAIATSGNYRNYFDYEGVRYSHTLNPKTGLPVQHDLLSVTVLAANSMQADGWATALMVLGGEKGYDLALKNQIAVLFVRDSESGIQQTLTPAFENYLKGFEK